MQAKDWRDILVQVLKQHLDMGGDLALPAEVAGDIRRRAPEVEARMLLVAIGLDDQDVEEALAQSNSWPRQRVAT